MDCGICFIRIGRHDTNKISCGECNTTFHCICANFKTEDLHYLLSSGNKYRCEKCNSIRRNSIRIDSHVIPVSSNSNLNALNTDTHNGTTTSISEVLLGNSESDLQNDNTPTLLFNTTTTTTSGDTGDNVNNKNSSKNSKTNEARNTLFSNNDESITLQMVYNKLISLESVYKDCLYTIKELKHENSVLRSNISRLKNKLNYIHQHELNNSIEIVGLPIPSPYSNVNCLSAVKKLLKDGLSLDISDEKIEKCTVKNFKQVKKDDSSNIESHSSVRVPGNRQVVYVKLKENSTKLQILRAKQSNKKMLNTSIFSSGKKQNKKIFINESLTNYNKALFMEAKKRKEEQKYKFLWHKNSKFFLKKNEDSAIILIRSFEDLKNIQ